MSYTFLLEQGEESSADTFSDIPQSVLSRLNLIAEKFCSKGNETESFPSSQSGTMSQPLTEPRGKEKSMSSVGDFHAKTYQSVNQMGTGLMANDQDSGPKWQGSFARFNPQEESSWKTRQHSLFGGWDEFSGTWPQWGTMLGGECWELRTPAAVTQGEGSGFMPTPCASDYKGGTNKPQKRNGELRTHQYKHWCKILHGLTYPIPMHMEAMMGWPIGWSALNPLETVSLQSWQQQHGGF
jgi:hypothetical protein